MRAAVFASSYSRMNPDGERATVLTPRRFASVSYACAAAYVIHGCSFMDDDLYTWNGKISSQLQRLYPVRFEDFEHTVDVVLEDVFHSQILYENRIRYLHIRWDVRLVHTIRK